MPLNKELLKCARCGKERRAPYPNTRYCSGCVNVAKECGYCKGPMAAYNRSGMCSRCRHAGKGAP